MAATDDSKYSTECLKGLERHSLKVLASRSTPLHKKLLVTNFTQKLKPELKPIYEVEDKQLFDMTVRFGFKSELINIFGDDFSKITYPLTSNQRNKLKQLIKIQIRFDDLLLDDIFSSLYDEKGVGFFRLKTPRHVKRLRDRVSQGDSALPLSDALKKDLHDIAESAMKKKPRFRHHVTESLYRSVIRHSP